MRHPTTNDMVERKIEVHKDKTLREATLEAYKVMCVCITVTCVHNNYYCLM